MKDTRVSVSLEEIQSMLTPFFQGHRIIKTIVFGSFATGLNSRKSDLDMILVMDTEERFFKRHDSGADIYDYLKGVSADILIDTPRDLVERPRRESSSRELERFSHRPFVKRVLKEGRVIYEC